MTDQTTKKNLSPFDFVKSVNVGRDDLFETGRTDYNAFLVNRALSYFSDTVFFANEMNKCSHLTPKMQYDFLRHIVHKRNRFKSTKWSKTSEDIKTVASYFGYTYKKAQQAILILGDDLVKRIKLEQNNMKSSKVTKKALQ